MTLAFPKPRRLRSRDLLREYALLHAECELSGCRRKGQVHHLRGRKLGGDEHSNLYALCAAHHAEWHSSGRETFWFLYNSRMTDEAKAKIRAVLHPRMEEA